MKYRKALFILEDISMSGSPLTALHIIDFLIANYGTEVDAIIFSANSDDDKARMKDFDRVVNNLKLMQIPHIHLKKFKMFKKIFLKQIVKTIFEMNEKRQYDIFYINRIGVAGTLAKAIKKKTRKKTFIVFHSLGNISVPSSRFWLLRVLDSFERKKASKYSDLLMCISDKSICSEMHLYNNKIRVFSDYSDLQPIENKIATRNNEINIGQIGYFAPNKNQLFTLSLLNELLLTNEKVKVHFLGFALVENYHRKVLEFIERNNLSSNVCFYDRDFDKIDFFKKIDILLIPSFSEGFPLTVLESFSQKTPCLVSEALPTLEINGYYQLKLSQFDEWKAFLLDKNRYSSVNFDSNHFKKSFDDEMHNIFDKILTK